MLAKATVEATLTVRETMPPLGMLTIAWPLYSVSVVVTAEEPATGTPFKARLTVVLAAGPVKAILYWIR